MGSPNALQMPETHRNTGGPTPLAPNGLLTFRFRERHSLVLSWVMGRAWAKHELGTNPFFLFMPLPPNFCRCF